jgi:hypothetical protein
MNSILYVLKAMFLLQILLILRLKLIFIMQFPEALKYTKDHEWIKIEGDVATVGIG